MIFKSDIWNFDRKRMFPNSYDLKVKNICLGYTRLGRRNFVLAWNIKIIVFFYNILNCSFEFQIMDFQRCDLEGKNQIMSSH